MTKILHIETATDICSVALSKEEEILSYITVPEANVHSAKLTLFIDEIMKDSDSVYTDLEAISVSIGPGSFTGLRIGVAVAKGICVGLDKPLIGINTLQSLVVAANRETTLTDELICTLIDARNNEVYFALYDTRINELMEPGIGILTPENLVDYSESNIIFVGDGVSKWATCFKGQPNRFLKEGILPDARNLVPLAFSKFQQKIFENISDFEPYYLRDFKAKKGFKIQKILNHS